MNTLPATSHDLIGSRQFFFEQAEVELKRAERYRVFVSLVALDISVINRIDGIPLADLVREIDTLTRQKVRACDYVSICDQRSLVALFPETSRQGAEIAGKRLGEALRARILELTDGKVDEVVPLEMASYPDAAGAQTVAAMLHDLASKSRN